MNESRPGFRVVLCTVDSEELARELAHALVQRRLAACVNLLPGVTSVYRWQGAVEEAREILLVIKTSPERYEELRRAIRERHPYETPEVIAWDLAAGDPDYLAWLGESL